MHQDEDGNDPGQWRSALHLRDDKEDVTLNLPSSKSMKVGDVYDMQVTTFSIHNGAMGNGEIVKMR